MSAENDAQMTESSTSSISSWTFLNISMNCMRVSSLLYLRLVKFFWLFRRLPAILKQARNFFSNSVQLLIESGLIAEYHFSACSTRVPTKALHSEPRMWLPLPLIWGNSRRGLVGEFFQCRVWILANSNQGLEAFTWSTLWRGRNALIGSLASYQIFFLQHHKLLVSSRG